MELKLQEYKQTDFDACMDLFDSNCPAYFAIEERIDYQNYLKFNEDKYLLGYIDESLIGCFGITKHDQITCSISWIMVSPSHHRGGYGSQMMEHFLDYVQKMNMKRVLVATSQHAENFFKKFGAYREGYIEDGWGKGMHQVNMEIDL